MKHKWKEFAELIGAPYRKKFATDGYGEFKIDNKGIYSYDLKEYEEPLSGHNQYIYSFLDGDIKVLNAPKDTMIELKVTTIIKK